MCRPWGFQEDEASRTSGQPAHEGGKVVNPRHPADIPGTHSC